MGGDQAKKRSTAHYIHRLKAFGPLKHYSQILSTIRDGKDSAAVVKSLFDEALNIGCIEIGTE